jgi:hypothetical protein
MVLFCASASLVAFPWSRGTDGLDHEREQQGRGVAMTGTTSRDSHSDQNCT